jgi:hypothetical protein
MKWMRPLGSCIRFLGRLFPVTIIVQIILRLFAMSTPYYTY